MRGLIVAMVVAISSCGGDADSVDAERAEFNTISQGLELYRNNIGVYPSTAHGLRALVKNPGVRGWDGPYLTWNASELAGRFRYERVNAHEFRLARIR
jgi:general secretion pathway protein G